MLCVSRDLHQDALHSDVVEALMTSKNAIVSELFDPVGGKRAVKVSGYTKHYSVISRYTPCYLYRYRDLICHEYICICFWSCYPSLLSSRPTRSGIGHRRVYCSKCLSGFSHQHAPIVRKQELLSTSQFYTVLAPAFVILYRHE